MAEVLRAITVNQRGVVRLRGGHVWVYRSDLVPPIEASGGSLVQVRDERGRCLGSAFYSSASQIAIRMVADEDLTETGLSALLRERIANAVHFRQQVARDTDSYRVIFSEADLLPGLIVDKYNDVLSMQALTQAFDREDLRQIVIEALAEHFPDCSLVERVDPHIRELEQLPERPSQLVLGERTSTIFTMNGVKFHFDCLGGQKTGAFLDQRENYAAAERHARGRALEICTYQGGFALHLNRVCEQVTAIDVSAEALVVAERNRELNGQKAIEFIEAEAFALMRQYADAERRYETIVLDPPAFAKSKKSAEDALRGYKELNLRALKMLRNGGVLITCSCSFHVSEQEFLAMLASAALDARRNLHLIEKRMQSADHPVLLHVPETHYLKCMVCSVF